MPISRYPKLKLLILLESEFASAVVYRRREEGAFGREEYGNMNEVILLPEIGVDLPLAELYDGAGIN